MTKHEVSQEEHRTDVQAGGTHRRRKTVFMIFGIGAAGLILCVSILFALSHRHTVEFNDWFVVGNTAENIIEKYGSFTLVADSTGENAVIRESNGRETFGSEWVVGYYCIDHLDLPHDSRNYQAYYTLVFDEQGYAVSVDVNILPFGSIAKFEQCKRHSSIFGDENPLFHWEFYVAVLLRILGIGS